MNRRGFKNYFPEPKFQLKFLLLLTVGALTQVVVTCSIVSYFVNQNYRLLVKYAGVDPQIVSVLSSELKSLLWTIGSVSTVFILGTIILGIIFSHKIAGPIFAIKRTIKSLRTGKAVELKFRKSDEFHDIAKEFNSLIHDLRSKSVA